MEDIKCDNCSSDKIHFVKYEMTNGVKMLRKQCWNCGKLLMQNYKRSLVNDFNLLPDYDKQARNKCKEKSIEKHEVKMIFFNFQSDYFERSYQYYHNIYLKSEEWKTKRDLIMKFYNYTCFDCAKEATDVHHISYDRIFKEKFSDLIPFCRTCHSKKHGYKF